MRNGTRWFDFWDYHRSARTDVALLVRLAGLKPGSRVLDVGCGTGRIGLELHRQFGDSLRYRGTEISAAHVEWCRKHFRNRRNFDFLHTEMQNDRYAPDATTRPRAETGELAEPNSVDVICAFSVFTHLLFPDVAFYLDQFGRSLSDNGRALTTLYVDERSPDVEENPDGFNTFDSSPLHRVRYRREFILAAVAAADLELVHEEPWREQQTLWTLGRKGQRHQQRPA